MEIGGDAEVETEQEAQEVGGGVETDPSVNPDP